MPRAAPAQKERVHNAGALLSPAREYRGAPCPRSLPWPQPFPMPLSQLPGFPWNLLASLHRGVFVDGKEATCHGADSTQWGGLEPLSDPGTSSTIALQGGPSLLALPLGGAHRVSLRSESSIIPAGQWLQVHSSKIPQVLQHCALSLCWGGWEGSWLDGSRLPGELSGARTERNTGLERQPPGNQNGQ